MIVVKLTTNNNPTVSQPRILVNFLFLKFPIIFSLALIRKIKNKITGEMMPFKTAEYIRVFMGSSPMKFKTIPKIIATTMTP